MATTHVQNKANGSDSAVTSIAETFVSTPTEDNVITAFGAARNAGATLTIDGAGWNQIFQTTINAAVMACWQKIAGASESSTVTINTSASDEMVILIIEGTGNHASAPEDQSATQSSGTDIADNETTPSITPTEDGTLVLAFILVRGAASAFDDTWTNGFTATETYVGAGGSDLGLAGGYLEQATAAAIDTNEGWGPTREHGSAIISLKKVAAVGLSIPVAQYYYHNQGIV